MNWIVYIKSSAKKALRCFPRKDYIAITEALREMAVEPLTGDTEKMSGEESYKRRVRNYRIKFELNSEDKLVSVYDIERRTTTTYRKR